jgi:hypothetical protein
MGLLKHFVLPALSVLHASALILAATKGRYAIVTELFDWPSQYAGDDVIKELSLWEDHCLGIIMGAHMALLFGCVAGIKHSEFCTLVTAMELIYCGNGAWDAYRLGMPCMIAMMLTTMCTVGLVVHYREPGVFTKDQSENNNRKKTK